MPRLTFDSTDAENRINERLDSITPISPINQGGLGKGLNDAYLEVLSEEIAATDALVVGGNPLTARSDFADNWGRFANVFRRQARTAEVSELSQNIKFLVSSGTFGDINNGEDIVLVGGTRIYTIGPDVEQGNVVYELSSEVTLLSTESVQYVSAIALTDGNAANVPPGVLQRHNFTDYTDYIRGSLLVTNETSISVGESVEDDIEFRRKYLTILRGEVSTTTGISNFIASLSGVSDVRALVNIDGLGAITFFIQGRTPITTSELVDTISDTVIAPLVDKGISVYVRAPEYIGVSLDIDIEHLPETTGDERTQIEQQMKSSLRNIIDGLPMGQQLSLATVRQVLIGYQNRVKRIGSSDLSDIISGVYVYKDSFGIRAPQKVTATIVPQQVEKIVLEYSIDNPINIRRL